MLSPQQAEWAARVISRMDRAQIIAQLRRCPARFPIDLTPEWLQNQPLAELRHVFAAICQQCGHIPEEAPPAPTRAA